MGGEIVTRNFSSLEFHVVEGMVSTAQVSGFFNLWEIGVKVVEMFYYSDVPRLNIQ